MDLREAGQLVTSVGVSALLVGVLNAFLGRRKMSAEATQIITNAAGSLTDRMGEQIERLQRRVDRLEHDEQIRDRLIHIHMAWDRAVLAELRRADPDRKPCNPPPLFPEWSDWPTQPGRKVQ